MKTILIIFEKTSSTSKTNNNKMETQKHQMRAASSKQASPEAIHILHLLAAPRADHQCVHGGFTESVRHMKLAEAAEEKHKQRTKGDRKKNVFLF